MEKVKILFIGTDVSGTDDTCLVVNTTRYNEIMISIENDDTSPNFICLDKMTAVRLVRELKKQIGNLKTDENE